MQHLALLLFGALLRTSSHLPSPLLLVISSNLPSLSPNWPAINFYLISQITSAHLTGNSMLYDNTLLCPRTLFSSPMGSWLGSKQPREATQLSLFQPPEELKEHRLGPNYSGRPLMRDTAEQLICEEVLDLVKETKYPEGEVRWESLKDLTTNPEDLNWLHLPWRPWWSNWTVWKFVDLKKEVKCPEGDIRRDSLKTTSEAANHTILLGNFSFPIS